MIADNNQTLTEFQKQFQKSFTSFCHHLPLVVSFGVDNSSVVLIEDNPITKERRILLTHTFDYSESVKKNIFDIKQKLIEFFPKFEFVQTVERSLTPEEILEADADPVELLEEKHIDYERTWYRIEKVLLLQDKVVVRNLTTNKCHVRKARCPVSVLIRNVRFNLAPSEQGLHFFKKTDFLKEVEEKLEA